MKKILTIIGARPQIIKAAAISRAIENNFTSTLEEILIHTGQHYDTNMSEVFFKELGIPTPHYQLAIGSGSHGEQTGKMLIEIEKILLKEKPDALLVYGDTNSTIAGSLAAVKLHVPVIHVEAGLRSFNKKMPEEINRIATDHFSTLLFSPTSTGISNLELEGFETSYAGKAGLNQPKTVHCGDIMYDNSLHFAALAGSDSTLLTDLGMEPNAFFLSTIHRPSNTDNPKHLLDILEGLSEISKSEGHPIIFPVHPRTKQKIESSLSKAQFEKIESQLKFIPPVSFLDMIALEQNAKMILTDSGGVQKEAYFFKKPCIILREETEWTEIVEAGSAILVGADKSKLIAAFNTLKHRECKFPPVFGDGQAAKLICQTILDTLS